MKRSEISEGRQTALDIGDSVTRKRQDDDHAKSVGSIGFVNFHNPSPERLFIGAIPLRQYLIDHEMDKVLHLRQFLFELDWSSFAASYTGYGRKPGHPALFLGLIIYGMLEGKWSLRELERLGIGRPSTYASMVQTLKQREYAKIQKKRLVPTNMGTLLCDFLVEHFPDLFAVPYTAHLEEALDEVARGEATRLAVLKAFWSDFTPQLGAAGQSAQLQTRARRPTPQPTGESCPACGGDLVERKGKHGSFIGCMNYPDCGYTRGLEHKPVTLRGAAN